MTPSTPTDRPGGHLGDRPATPEPATGPVPEFEISPTGKSAENWEPHSNLEASGKRHLGPTGLAIRRLLRNKLAVLGLVYILFLFALAAFGPGLWKYKYDQITPADRLSPPSLKHPFGTDILGRDLFAQTMEGARVSLAVGVYASLIAIGIGVVYGGIAGYLGGRLGRVMMRAVDIIYAIPLLLIVIMLIIVFEGRTIGGEPISRMTIIFIAMGITFWLPMARIVRAKVLSLKEMEYCLAARSMGASHARILFKILLPNSLGPIIVMITLNIPEAIFAEAFLSYIGLGITAPKASWGTLASEGTQYIRTPQAYLLLFPALAISTTMLAFNFLGDGLRDAFDPQQKNV